MARRFREHDLRTVLDLEGLWDFVFAGERALDDVDLDALEYDDFMPVPGCFDALPRYAGRRGIAAYRRRVRITEPGTYRLVLDGVHHHCRAFVDGRLVGEHGGGFTRFGLDLGELSAGEIELSVLVDNGLDSPRSPLHAAHFDWYQFGGIARSAKLERTAGAWIERLKVVTSDVQTPELRVRIDYRCARPPLVTRLVVSVDGQVVQTDEVELLAPSGRIERRLAVPGAKLWSPAEPNLHLIHVQLGEDDLRERIGIRQVRVQGKNLCINGEPVRLLGVSRHQLAPLFGHALPDAIDAADVQLLRRLGANFVRGAHYPQSSGFLDLCDEVGICVWSEALGFRQTKEQLTDPQFLEAQRRHIEEMVAMSENHPSLVIWGVSSEGRSDDPECRPAFEALLGALRTANPTRPVSYASMFPFDDRCFDLADIVAVDFRVGDVAAVTSELDRVVTHLDAAHPDKPIAVFGLGCEALFGCNDAEQGPWTEAYQAKLLDTAIRHLFLQRDRVCGLAIRQFCDTRAASAGGTERVRGYDNSGIFDEYRRPKRAVETVAAAFQACWARTPRREDGSG